MKQLYKLGEEISLLDNGKITTGKILKVKGFGKYRKYGVLLTKRVDGIMCEDYKVAGYYTEQTLRSMLSYINEKTGTPQITDSCTENSNVSKHEIRNLLLGAIFMFLSVFLMIISITAKTNLEKVLCIISTSGCIVIGYMLIWRLLWYTEK